METTAKVDVRKLQILNDRINQTIDALHQLRLSVHGYQPTGVTGGFPQQQQFGMPGLQHTGIGQTYGMQGYGIDPRIAQMYGVGVQGINPYQMLGQVQWPQQYGQQNPFVGQQGVGGLSHTGLGMNQLGINQGFTQDVDPVRMMQIFPNLFAPVNPLPF